MRYFLLAFCFFLFFSSCQREARNTEQAAPDAPVLATEAVGRFTPLADNERFAVLHLGASRPGADVVRPSFMTFYAVRNNDITDITELFTWENVLVPGADDPQFTSDFRTAFFRVRAQEPLPFPLYALYMANGSTGEIKRLPILVPSAIGGNFRVTKDGKFAAYPRGGQGGQAASVLISVFDIEAETMTQLTWRVTERGFGGWLIFRSDNGFMIHRTGEGGDPLAIAELDPATMELRTLWDNTDWSKNQDDIPIPPNYHSMLEGSLWVDDVVLQWRDPNVRLRR